MALYHITTRSEAEAAAAAGTYRPRAFDAEGFVHCSHAHQVARVANRRFRGQPDLVLLEIDAAAVGAPVVEENLEGGSELFPHVYGPLPMASVVAVHELPCGEDGRFAPPPGAGGR